MPGFIVFKGTTARSCNRGDIPLIGWDQLPCLQEEIVLTLTRCACFASELRRRSAGHPADNGFELCVGCLLSHASLGKTVLTLPPGACSAAVGVPICLESNLEVLRLKTHEETPLKKTPSSKEEGSSPPLTSLTLH